MAATPLDERRFNALAGYTRGPLLVRYAQEYDWLATDDERVLGVLTWDRSDRDFGWIALGRDQRRQYRAVEVNSSMTTTEAARAELLAAMERLQGAPDEEFTRATRLAIRSILLRPSCLSTNAIPISRCSSNTPAIRRRAT